LTTWPGPSVSVSPLGTVPATTNGKLAFHVAVVIFPPSQAPFWPFPLTEFVAMFVGIAWVVLPPK
jgi:hypothetical protein